jgi:hypothetical protein
VTRKLHSVSFFVAEKFVIMMSLTKMLELLDPSKFSRTQELCGKLEDRGNNI